MEASILSSRSSIITSVIIVVLVFSAVGGFIFMSNPYVPAKIAVVVNEPGFGDLTMADQVDTGLDDLAGDIVVDYTRITATDEANAAVILEEISASGEYNLIVVIGGELGNELQTVAANHLNQKYVFIGGEIIASNVISATFLQHEAAFLAGALAALASIGDENRTGTSIIGIIGSVEADPTVASLIAGFKQGIDYANDTLNVNVTLLPEQYVGSYNDSAEAESIATAMFDGSNATILFTPVRASMPGIRSAMILANSTWNSTRRPLVIAAEGDQDYFGLPDIETRTGQSWIITSIVPRSDLAVYQAINATLWNVFEADTDIYDLEASGEDTETPGVILTHSDFIDYDWTPEWMFEIIESIRQDIIDGVITVSTTYP
jgi:basic membrane protein A